ncbi:MAG: glycosyltransferase family 4 protein [Bacteroidales bacterium]|nr:glycosyltransferase family 4 protein [Bacteroidales bacterium]
MRIAVNTRLLLPNKLDGIGFFTYETLKRITKANPEHEFYFIFDRPYSEEFIFSDNVIPVVAHPQARHPYLWYLFFEYSIPRKLKKIKPDLFLSTDGWIPTKLNIKTVNVIHDLNFVHFPDFIKPVLYRHYFKRFFPLFAKKPDRIVTVSNFSKQDIVKTYNIPADKIDVVFNGSDERYKPVDEKTKNIIKEKYTNSSEFFLFVGTIHKRKNLDNIFRAFDLFKQKNESNFKLVVVGQKKWWKGDIEDSFNSMQYKDDVIFLGRVEIEELHKITASAFALLYVSLFEGFGIPILEAFNAETPVITSNVSSMPEVAGDAAMLVNPNSVDEIAMAMDILYKNEDIRNMLIERGRVRKEMFSWENTAKSLWKTIDKVLQS